jgi:beta-N-acetylhexosaminidase
MVFARMTPAQRVGQLFMVGLHSGAGRSSLDGRITSLHLGGVLYLGGWSGGSWIGATSAHLQRLAGRRATAGVRLLIAADQEGGQVQELEGQGFSDIPSALRQGLLAPATLQTRAAGWGRELARVGVNVSLAPVGDTVPAELGRDNGPIGRFDREFGHEPARVGASVVAVVKGMTAARIQPTVKHFPGLGRIRENTDFSSTGITDRVTTMSDPYLGPFADGIDVGTGLIMVSSAWYPRIDARNQAVFSRTVITTLLRGRLGYGGVVISDDVGAARAVASVSPGNRAVRFIAAGGDIVLTADPGRAGIMVSAITKRMARDQAFAGTVETAVRRVLALKARMGLVDCGG